MSFIRPYVKHKTKNKDIHICAETAQNNSLFYDLQLYLNTSYILYNFTCFVRHKTSAHDVLRRPVQFAACELPSETMSFIFLMKVAAKQAEIWNSVVHISFESNLNRWILCYLTLLSTLFWYIHQPRMHEMVSDGSSRAESWTDLRKMSMRVFFGSNRCKTIANDALPYEI